MLTNRQHTAFSLFVVKHTLYYYAITHESLAYVLIADKLYR